MSALTVRDARIAAVLFDMDGVLVDVSGSYRRAIRETAEALTGAPVSAEEVQGYKNRGGFNDDWALTHAIVKARGVEIGRDEVVAAFQARYLGAQWQGEPVGWDGYIAGEPALVRTETLEAAAERWALALVTGRPEAEARYTLARHGWTDLFPVVVAKEQTGDRPKPAPLGLTEALRQLGERRGTAIPSQQAAYIGDTVDDMRAARAAGMLAVGTVPPGLDFRSHAGLLTQAGAHAVLSAPDALPELIRTLA